MYPRGVPVRGKFASVEGNRKNTSRYRCLGVRGRGLLVWREIISLTFVELQMKTYQL